MVLLLLLLLLLHRCPVRLLMEAASIDRSEAGRATAGNLRGLCS
jgi:hypothetical protein